MSPYKASDSQFPRALLEQAQKPIQTAFNGEVWNLAHSVGGMYFDCSVSLQKHPTPEELQVGARAEEARILDEVKKAIREKCRAPDGASARDEWPADDFDVFLDENSEIVRAGGNGLQSLFINSGRLVGTILDAEFFLEEIVRLHAIAQDAQSAAFKKLASDSKELCQARWRFKSAKKYPKMDMKVLGLQLLPRCAVDNVECRFRVR